MRTAKLKIHCFAILYCFQFVIMMSACMDDNDVTLVFPNEYGERVLADNGEIILPEKNIELALWDWGDVDHDTVSVFINNKTIVKELFLRGASEKYVVQSTLDKKRNDLIILTHNEGTRSPNTVAFSIKSGEVYVKKDKETGMATNELYRLVIE